MFPRIILFSSVFNFQLIYVRLGSIYFFPQHVFSILFNIFFCLVLFIEHYQIQIFFVGFFWSVFLTLLQCYNAYILVLNLVFRFFVFIFFAFVHLSAFLIYSFVMTVVISFDFCSRVCKMMQQNIYFYIYIYTAISHIKYILMNNLNYAIMPNHDVVKLCHWSGIFVSQNINKKNLFRL